MVSDPYWLEAWHCLAGLVTEHDRVVWPKGSWPPLPCRTAIYEDRVRVYGADILLLHKSNLGSIDRTLLAELDRNWHVFFANPVFVGFTRYPLVPAMADAARFDLEYGIVRHMLHGPRELPFRIIFVHLPKTAGTSLWNVLKDALPKHIYVVASRPIRQNAASMGAYDLIGGHFNLSVMLPLLQPEDIVVSVLRDPVDRVRSAFMHARRETADAATFREALARLRVMKFGDFLHSARGAVEVTRQMLILGEEPDDVFSMAEGLRAVDQDNALQKAIKVLDHPNLLVAPMERLDDLVAFLGRRIGRELRLSTRANVTERRVYERNQQEFDSAREAVQAATRWERLFCDIAAEQFDHRLRDLEARHLRALQDRQATSKP